MLDLQNEEIISLTEATSLLPRRRRGRKPHVATLYRWAQRGCRGVVLETCQVGGTKCTSVEALQRFVDRLSRRHADPREDDESPTAQEDHDKAEQELDADGW